MLLCHWKIMPDKSSRCVVCGVWTTPRDVRHNVFGRNLANTPEESILKEIVGEKVYAISSVDNVHMKVSKFLCRKCHTKLVKLVQLDIDIREKKLETQRVSLFNMLTAQYNTAYGNDSSVAPSIEHIPCATQRQDGGLCLPTNFTAITTASVVNSYPTLISPLAQQTHCIITDSKPTILCPSPSTPIMAKTKKSASPEIPTSFKEHVSNCLDRGSTATNLSSLPAESESKMICQSPNISKAQTERSASPELPASSQKDVSNCLDINSTSTKPTCPVPGAESNTQDMSPNPEIAKAKKRAAAPPIPTSSQSHIPTIHNLVAKPTPLKIPRKTGFQHTRIVPVPILPRPASSVLVSTIFIDSSLKPTFVK